jgi:virginiamycin B lyase
MWFVDEMNRKIGRIPLTATSASQITYTTTPTGVSDPSSITLGPDGNLWFTEQSVNQIGKLVP